MIDPEKIKKSKLSQFAESRNLGKNEGPKNIEDSKSKLSSGIERAAEFNNEKINYNFVPENLPVEVEEENVQVPLEWIDLGSQLENNSIDFTNSSEERTIEDVGYGEVFQPKKITKTPEVKVDSTNQKLNRIKQLEKELSETKWWWDFIKRSNLKFEIGELKANLNNNNYQINSNDDSFSFDDVEKQKDAKDYRDLKDKLKTEKAKREIKIKSAEARLEILKKENKEKARAAFQERYEKSKNLPLVNKFLERGKLFLDNNEGRKKLAKNAGYAALLIGVGSLTGGAMIAAGVPAVAGVVASVATTGAITGGIKTYIDKWRGKVSAEDLKKKLLVNAALGAGFGATGAYFFPYIMGSIPESVKEFFVTPASSATLTTKTVDMPIPVQQEFIPADLDLGENLSAQNSIEQEIITPIALTSQIYQLKNGESVWSTIAGELGLGESVAGNAHKLHGKELAEYVSGEIKKQGLSVGENFSSMYEKLLAKGNITGQEKFWRSLPSGLNLDLSQILKIITK